MNYDLKIAGDTKVGVFLHDVKQMMLDESVQLGGESSIVTSLYYDYLLLDGMERGDVLLWLSDGRDTKTYEGRYVTPEIVQSIAKVADAVPYKLLRIERFKNDFDINELKVVDIY